MYCSVDLTQIVNTDIGSGISDLVSCFRDRGKLTIYLKLMTSEKPSARKPQERKLPRSFSIPIRLSRPEIDLIEKAADLVGENRAEFVRGAAKQKAMDVINSTRLKVVAGGEAQELPSAVSE